MTGVTLVSAIADAGTIAAEFTAELAVAGALIVTGSLVMFGIKVLKKAKLR